MKSDIVTKLLEALLVVLNPEMIKAFLDAGLDAIEEAIKKSPTKWDDMFVLPVCTQIRRALNIPDEDIDAMKTSPLDDTETEPPEI